MAPLFIYIKINLIMIGIYLIIGGLFISIICYLGTSHIENTLKSYEKEVDGYLDGIRLRIDNLENPPKFKKGESVVLAFSESPWVIADIKPKQRNASWCYTIVDGKNFHLSISEAHLFPFKHNEDAKEKISTEG